MKQDAVKVAIVDAEENILVLRRSGSHPYYPYHPDFPGGDVDDDESTEQAILREVREETGLEVRADRLRHVRSWDNHYGSRHHVYFLLTDQVTPRVTISWEHDHHEWKPLATLLQEDQKESIDQFYTAIVGCLETELPRLRTS